MRRGFALDVGLALEVGFAWISFDAGLMLVVSLALEDVHLRAPV